MFTKWYPSRAQAPFKDKIDAEGFTKDEIILSFPGRRFQAENHPTGALCFSRTEQGITLDHVASFGVPKSTVLPALVEKLAIVTHPLALPDELASLVKTPVRLFRTGPYPTGPLNLITDVAGVRVGHASASFPTGITLIEEAPDDVFKNKVIGAVYAYNGFGKTVGSVQVEELGTIETPIGLTNTFDVPLVSSCLIADALDANTVIGTVTGTVNALVGECNDSGLENIRSRRLTRADYDRAKASLSTSFAQGSVGAGRGMKCLGFKGGIGSASRVITRVDFPYTLGVLVNANFGSRSRLTVLGRAVGEDLAAEDTPDKGSIMVILATDAPLTSREMTRLIKRCELGIARTGSYAGHGSGDIMIGFTTANRVKHFARDLETHDFLPDALLNPFFEAAADATEEAVLNALYYADTTESEDGSTTSRSLRTELERFDDVMGEAHDDGKTS